MKTIDLRERLLSDHRRLEKLFEQLRDAFDANAREDTQTLWTELETGLEKHFEAEEKYLFPKFQRLDATETKALLEEHALIRQRLAELGAGVDLKLVRADVAKGFLDAIRAHAQREDTILYRWAQEAMAKEAGTIVDLLTS